MMPSFVDGMIVVLYMIAMIAIGFWGFKKAESLEDYLVAGRSVRLWMYIPVMSAVILGGGSTIGGSRLGYTFGISGAWLVIMLGLGIVAVGLLISTNLSNLKAFTLGQVLERRYDKYSGTVGAAIATVYSLTIGITQTIAIGVVFNALFGISPVVATITGGVIVILYTALGGMWSVTITDLFQWVIMTVGIFLAIPFGLNAIGGFDALRQNLDPSFFSMTNIGTGRILSFFLLYFLGVMIGQDIWQRVFTADKPETARIGNVVAGAYAVVYGLATAFLGMIAVVLFLPEGGLPDANLALPMLIIKAVPVGLTGLVLAALVSAMMSTADAALLASSTLFTNDIYRRFINTDAPEATYTAVSRLSIVVFGVIMIGAAVIIGDVINALTLAYNLLTGAIFVPILFAFFWRGGTWQGAVTSIVVASVVTITTMIVYGFESDLPIIYGLATSLTIFVGVSLFTGPPPRQQLETWERDKASPSEVRAVPASGS